MKKSDKDELLSCDRYVNKRSRPVFYTKKYIFTTANLCENYSYVTNKRFKSN